MGQPVIGILAGMGPSSTGPFIDLVVAECRAQYGARDDMDFPKMFIVSQPAPFFHDREVDHEAIAAATAEGLRDLERAGADVIGIACNSVHLYFPRLVASISTPLLDIVAEAFDAVPVGARTIAIAASRPLAESGLYQSRAVQRGFTLIEPDWQPQIDAIQDAVKTEASPEAIGMAWAALFSRLVGAGEVDAIVLACLDLSGVFRFAKPPVSTVDAARALAARLVSEWHERSVAAG